MQTVVLTSLIYQSGANTHKLKLLTAEHFENLSKNWEIKLFTVQMLEQNILNKLEESFNLIKNIVQQQQKLQFVNYTNGFHSICYFLSTSPYLVITPAFSHTTIKSCSNFSGLLYFQKQDSIKI